MNDRNRPQLSMEHLPRHRHMLEVGWNGRNHRVHAEAIEEADSFAPFRLAPYARLLEPVVLAKWSASETL